LSTKNLGGVIVEVLGGDGGCQKPECYNEDKKKIEKRKIEVFYSVNFLEKPRFSTKSREEWVRKTL